MYNVHVRVVLNVVQITAAYDLVQLTTLCGLHMVFSMAIGILHVYM